MAAAVNIPPVPNPPQANAVPPAPPATPDNYLSRCVSELTPQLIAAHESNASLFSVAAKVVLASFIILAVGAFIATGILAPIYIPIAAVVAFCLKYPAFQFYEHLMSYSRDIQGEADRLKLISQKFNELPNEPRLVAMKLAAISILWSTIPGVQQLEDLDRLKPLIARYDYWIDRKALCETNTAETRVQIQELEAQIATAPEEQKAELRNTIRAHRYDILNVEQKALACKVHAAFLHAVIKRPDFAGDFETLAKFTPTDIQDRAVARQFNDMALANNFVEFPGSNVHALTLDEIKAQPITVIAQRFIQAMPVVPAA